MAQLTKRSLDKHTKKPLQLSVIKANCKLARTLDVQQKTEQQKYPRSPDVVEQMWHWGSITRDLQICKCRQSAVLTIATGCQWPANRLKFRFY
jgi:hypothetical protein